MLRYILTPLIGIIAVHVLRRQAPKLTKRIGGKKGVWVGQILATIAPFVVNRLLRTRKK